MTTIELPTRPETDVIEDWEAYGHALVKALEALGVWTSRLLKVSGDHSQAAHNPRLTLRASRENAEPALPPVATQRWWRELLADATEAEQNGPSDAMDIDAPPGFDNDTYAPGERAARVCTIPLPHGRPTLNEMHGLLHRLDMYYLDHVAGGTVRWVTEFKYSRAGSRMSMMTLVFLSLMQVRLLCQSVAEVSARDPHYLCEHNLAARTLAFSERTFPTLRRANADFDRTVPISRYTQSEVDQAVTMAMFKVTRVAWSREMHYYLHLLAHRMAVLFACPHRKEVLNIEAMRQPVSSGVLRFLDPTSRAGDAPLFSYNFDFLVRCSWRYYYMVHDLVQFEQLVEESDAPESLCAQHVAFPRYLPKVYYSYHGTDQVARLARHLEETLLARVARYSHQERITVYEKLRPLIMAQFKPQGDYEWARFKYPQLPLGPSALLDSLHQALSKVVLNELFPVPAEEMVAHYLKARDPGAPLHYLYLYTVVFLFDKHMVAGTTSLRFRERFVVTQDRSHLLLPLLQNAREPFLRQWLGRYYLGFNNSVSFASPTLFGVIAEWLILAQRYAPELWAEIVNFGADMLPVDFIEQGRYFRARDGLIASKGYMVDVADDDGDDDDGGEDERGEADAPELPPMLVL